MFIEVLSSKETSVQIQPCPSKFTLFDYFYSRQPEQIRIVKVDEDQNPQIESSHLDYKFLRLKENEALADRNGLSQYVRNRSSQENLVTIVGHPGGNEMREETCVVVGGANN